MNNVNISKLVTKIWMDADPSEGRSLWYDAESGWQTNCRAEAIKWVKDNQKELAHFWDLN